MYEFTSVLFCIVSIVIYFIYANELQFLTLQDQYFAKYVEDVINTDQKIIHVVDLNATVEVFYLEYLLASWEVEEKTWNTYHSGIGFKINDSILYAIDYVPLLNNEIGNVIVPSILPVYDERLPQVIGLIYAYVFSSYNISWNNPGVVKYYDRWPSKFNKMTKVGIVNGTVFNEYIDWISQWGDEHTRFDPFEVFVNNSLYIRSNLCHDLFSQSFEQLKLMGLVIVPNVIFRDHVRLFVKDISHVDLYEEKRKILYYYRFFILNFEFLVSSLQNTRSLVAYVEEQLDISKYVYVGGEYYKVKMMSPYLDYCYGKVDLNDTKEELCLFE